MEEKTDDSLCEGGDFLDTQFSSQDNLLELSQDGSTQCDVRWDYTSPETTKQLKKTRGKYSVQDVKRLVANFPDLPIKQVPSSFDRIKLSMQPKYFDVVPEKNKINKAKQRAAKRWQQREKCRGAVEDMLNFLQQQEKAKTGDRPFEVSAEKVSSSQDKEKDKQYNAEDTWSDDDLFRDNSFLIEATQNLEQLLNKAQDKKSSFVDSNGPKTKPSTSARSNETLFSSTSSSSSLYSTIDSTSVIPSSYSGRLDSDTNISSSKTLFGFKFSNNVNKMPISSINVKSSKNGCYDSNRPVVIQNSKKSSTSKASSPLLNSPFRRALSFDSSTVSNSKGKKNEPLCQNKVQMPKPSESMSFESSFSDDILLQATADLDAICVPPLVNNKTKVSMPRNGKPSYNCDPQSSSSTHKKLSYATNTTTISSHKRSKDLNITNTLLSPVRPMLQEAKRLQTKPANSPVQSFFKRSFNLDGLLPSKHKSPAGPHSSTPVKILKTAVTKDVASDKPQNADSISDSFLDDDSFMNDDALFESQILPILELAETQVPAKKSSESLSPVKYSPDEIEKKRQAALQKLRKNTCTQNPHQSSPNFGGFAQSQTAGSPQKCSQEEIDRKKKAAQRKLLAKTNSTGSINFSQSCTNVREQKSPQNLYEIDLSPRKCSQEEIKTKREEALKKRQLKLERASTRKS